MEAKKKSELSPVSLASEAAITKSFRDNYVCAGSPRQQRGSRESALALSDAKSVYYRISVVSGLHWGLVDCSFLLTYYGHCGPVQGSTHAIGGQFWLQRVCNLTEIT